MTTLIEQLKTGLLAAVALLGLLGVLYVVFGVWMDLLDRFVRAFGLTAAFLDFVARRDSRGRWWFKVANSVNDFLNRKMAL